MRKITLLLLFFTITAFGQDPMCDYTLEANDSFGDGCDWYENDPYGCAAYGHDVGPDGLNANEVCCVCGGTVCCVRCVLCAVCCGTVWCVCDGITALCVRWYCCVVCAMVLLC